ncbi:Phosphoribosylanthranilate isomerase [Minicystis rosea]|nr:Phosphoribosylanthranilate isomerase [Minicystis rosea]
MKICGVTRVADAVGCVALGVDMIGLNFVQGSPRRVDVTRAHAIIEAVRAHDGAGGVEIVGVVADMDEPALIALRYALDLDRLQLHGSETPKLVRRLHPHAFKALRVGDASDVAEADSYEGLILCDAKVPGALGGTGQLVDFSLVAPLAKARPILLAGGLTPANVADAVRAVEPWGVDTASGVERFPGTKDLAAVEAFVKAARAARA